MKQLVWQRSLTFSLSLFLVLPLLPLLLWSLANRWQYPHTLPQQIGLDGWRNFLANGGVSAIAHSILIGTLVTLLVIPTSFMAAQAITKSRTWAMKLVEVILFIPVFLPPFVLVMGVTTASITVGAIPLVAVVVTLGVLAMPYSTFIFRSAFLNYDSAWEEEGKLLGASKPSILLRVRVRMLQNSLFAAVIVTFLIGWSDYIVTLTVGGGQVLSLPLLIGSSASAPGNDSSLAAMALVSIFFPVVIVGVTQIFLKSRKRRG